MQGLKGCCSKHNVYACVSLCGLQGSQWRVHARPRLHVTITKMAQPMLLTYRQSLASMRCMYFVMVRISRHLHLWWTYVRHLHPQMQDLIRQRFVFCLSRCCHRFLCSFFSVESRICGLTAANFTAGSALHLSCQVINFIA